MASYAVVRDAIADTVRAVVPNVSVHPTVPKSVTVPAAIVRPGRPSVTYRQAYSSTLAMWRVELLVLLTQVSEKAAQERLADLVAPESPLVVALNAVEFDPGWLAVVDARIGETGPYASATFNLTATA